MATDFNRILSDLKKRIYYPVYLLSGEEPYFIDLISDAIEGEVLSDIEKEFNQTILYGRDVNVSIILDHAKRYPMMSSHQVVIVKEAQEIKALDDLIPYIEKPLNTTILVLCYKYKKFDKRKSVYKLIEKKGVVFDSARIYEEKIPGWIVSQVEANGYTISPKAASMISDALGNDLSKVSNELGKLYINLPKASLITEKLVEDNIGISKDYNFFELQKALVNRNIPKANRIIAYFASNPKENPLIKNVILLFHFFSKVLLYHSVRSKTDAEVASVLGVPVFFLNDYKTAVRCYSPGKVVEIISLLREYDLKSKGVDAGSATDGELTKELIYKILH
jgi:DNA polymerase-3 subunit delta